MASLCVKSVAFPPVDGAPVPAVAKQTALYDGCGSELGQGVGKLELLKHPMLGQMRQVRA
jgi:hypothetical protein